MDAPWLATSSSGHKDTNPSSSRSMMAVRRSVRCMLRVYTLPHEREANSRTCSPGHFVGPPGHAHPGTAGLLDSFGTGANPVEPWLAGQPDFFFTGDAHVPR